MQRVSLRKPISVRYPFTAHSRHPSTVAKGVNLIHDLATDTMVLVGQGTRSTVTKNGIQSSPGREFNIWEKLRGPEAIRFFRTYKASLPQAILATAAVMFPQLRQEFSAIKVDAPRVKSQIIRSATIKQDR